MDNRVISYLACDNCTCIVNKVYSFNKNNHIEYHLVLCKKCHILLQGDYELNITKCNYTMSKLPSTELRKQYLQMAIKERDRCREARAMNKKRDEERWAFERGECLISDD